MRNRTCERRDENVAKVAVNKTKCNGSDMEELGNGKLTAIEILELYLQYWFQIFVYKLSTLRKNCV